MDSNRRNFIDIVLVIALVVGAIFLFNRVQNLNTTRDDLANTQAEGTQVSALAATYSEEGTARAEQAAADAETAANQLANAEATGTQSAIDSAAALDSANATATQSAVDSAAALDSANTAGTQSAADLDAARSTATQSAAEFDAAQSTATQSARNSANTLATANAVGTQSARSAATQQAQAQAENEALTSNLSDAEATASTVLELQVTQLALQGNLEDEVAALSTAQAEAADTARVQMTAIADVSLSLQAANDKASEQATAIADAEATIVAQADAISAAPSSGTDSPDTSDSDLPRTNDMGFVLVEADDVTLYLPTEYLVMDAATVVSMLDTGDLPDDARMFLEIMEENPDLIFLLAVNFSSRDGEITLGMRIEMPVRMTPELFMDFGYIGMEDSILEQDIVEMNGREVVRTVQDNGDGSLMLQYAFIEDSMVYVLAFQTTPNAYEERRDIYDAIAETFAVRD